jgi:hypothetical protein
MTDSPFLSHPSPVTERYDTHVANAWVGENRFIFSPPESSELPSYVQARGILPDPFWSDHQTAIDCYWRAWELAFSNLEMPSEKNGFIANYCDTAFNGNLFMWDSAFVTFKKPWTISIANSMRMGLSAAR